MAAGHIDLKKAFLDRQKLLSAELELPLQFTSHPTTIGDASEANWGRMLRSFLPGRYEVGPAFALDAKGNQSQQVDLAIYDRQYSPLWFQSGSSRFVPVESIYAVFEVKQNINVQNLRYAADKIASVRSLSRTSAKIVDIYGTQAGPDPLTRPILGGLLALRSDWIDGLQGHSAKNHIDSFSGAEWIDFGLALDDSAFDHIPRDANTQLLTPGIEFAAPGTQLIFFVMRLFRRLQAIGSAMAVDLEIYERVLKETDADAYDENDIEAQ
ncbi:DUF6602 domain-containing protein [Microbacterium sp. 1P10AE]|uniref:DUF6602 domain-containing protein n=1 Tax=Microbacterium sp. 1P10AE TaxID=3132286 RepID=UPI0039A3AA98